MKTEIFIAWRYLITKRKEKIISLTSAVSVLGVAIGVMALIVVIAVMTGFDQDLRHKIVGNYSHITLSHYQGITSLEYARISRVILNNPHVRGLSPHVQGQALAKQDNRYFAVGLKGIDPATEGSVSDIGKYLIKGSLSDLGKDTVIIGKELAVYLGVKIGSAVTFYSPSGKLYNLKVAGIFSSGMYDYDLNLAFTHLKTAQEIFGLNDAVSNVAIKLDNLYQAKKVSSELLPELGLGYNLKTWMEANQNFFAALKLEKLTMFIILTLIILVAAFNIVSTLSTLVVEKTKDIGILKAVGMNSARIRRVFTYEGLLIGGLGTLSGTLGGVGLCLLLKKYQFIRLPQDIYYLDKLPVSLNWLDLLLIILAAMLISLVSTLYPASQAAKLSPVEALRYE